MKKKELKDYKEKSVKELNKEVRALKIKIDDLKARTLIGREKNTSQVRNLKKNVAQIMTLLSLKEKEGEIKTK